MNAAHLQPCFWPASYNNIRLTGAVMAEKRKHDESVGSDQSRLPPNDRRPSTSPVDDSLAVVENYPRKRIAIAVGRNCFLLRYLDYSYFLVQRL